ncbi:MAG TPA: hypothetical protein VKZ60_03105 [Chloroflexota bacterium]|jgi:hypothetical protein|nr:hypothetical protein [Chloroflexota bacterium]
MRCEALTRKGVPCARPALRGERVCANHAGRCGARPGNRNALRHGLYSRQLSAVERVELFAARAMAGLDEEIALTRLLILRALRERDPGAYARLAETLCRQLRTQRQLSGAGADSLAAALGKVLDEVAAELGIGA